MFSSYGLAFWYGAKLLGEGKMEAGNKIFSSIFIYLFSKTLI